MVSQKVPVMYVCPLRRGFLIWGLCHTWGPRKHTLSDFDTLIKQSATQYINTTPLKYFVMLVCFSFCDGYL